METLAVAEVTLENLEDLWAVERGLLTLKQARNILICDALADPQVTHLCLPTHAIKKPGLTRQGSRHVDRRMGYGQADLYGPVRLTILGRSCTMDVMEVPDTFPVLIGQLALTHLDLVIEPRAGTLIGNPAHGGEHIYELY